MDQDRVVVGKLRPATAAWLAWSFWASAFGLSLASTLVRQTPSSWFNAVFFALATTGAVIAWRRPANPIGWLYLAMGFLVALTTFAQQYAIRGLLDHPGSLPGAVFMAWLEQWSLWFAFPAGIASALLILFPTGRPASRFWWGVLWLGFAFAGLMVFGSMFVPRELSDALRQASGPGADFNVRNPAGIDALIPLRPLIGIVGRFGAYLVLVLAAIGLVIRLLRAKGEERQQLKWIAFVGAAVALGIVGMLLAPFPALQDFAFSVVIIGLFVGLPVATVIAVLKYRLYDIDVVINKTLLFGTMAAFITAVYVGIVVGIGHLVGTGGQPNLGLSIAATALVAIAFQPVRERAQRVANLLVYGKRATPYEVLAEFSDRIASTYSTDEILPRLAQTIAESTGAAQAVVWAKEETENTTLASWPEPIGSPTPPPGASSGGSSSDRVVPVQHQGELLGAVSIRKPAGEAITPVDQKLLANLASQAGVVLRNLRLTRELEARVGEISAQTAELQASSARIIAAQDSTRRRLERNIHDGAQQHLVAIAVKLRLAATLARRDPDRATRLLDELEAETQLALETLHALARGIYPPILREQGLESAIRAQATRFTLPVDVDAKRLGRFPPEVEGAVYFSCLEALQNIAKHAAATRVRIQLGEAGDDLVFSISDDGAGFDPAQQRRGSGLQNIADRVAALGGTLDIRSAPGCGATLIGRIPARAAEPVA